MRKQTLINHLILIGIFSIVVAASAWADPITVAVDPTGDFLTTYTGPKNGDLDVLSTQATQNGTVVVFSATLNGNVGATDGGFYVFGIDRGAGTARFGVITVGGNTYDASGVKFDSVVIFRPGTSLTVTDLITGASSTLPLSNVAVTGSSFQVTVPLSFLGSQGFSSVQYTFNLWPRFAGATGNGAISDFAPNNSNAAIAQTPEPTTLLLLGTGLAGLAFKKRRARRTV